MLLGQQIGPFLIEKELGSGAMGTVYRARYTKTGQRVALKMISPGLGSNEKGLARFEREAAILKQLRHANIVRMLGTGKFQGTPFYAMEYVDGETLDQVLRRRDRFTWEEVVDIGKQICAALHHAHVNGIVHRDLKPSNIMVTRDGVVKLTDFGIAKDLDVTGLTSAHCTVGTAAYMSPEQCKGAPNLTHRSDLYSLGVLLYELLTGRRPFQADNAIDMFMMHVKGTFERPSRIRMDIPVWLDTLVCQLLEKKPERRPIDAEMVAKVLDEVREKIDTLKSAGVDLAAKVARKSKDETERRTAETLMTGARKKKKKRSYSRLEIAFKALGLTVAVAGIFALIAYVFWPDSAEELYRKGENLLAHGDQLFDAGNTDDAWHKWMEAKDKYFKRITEKFPGDALVDKAKEKMAQADAGDLYLDGLRRFDNEDPASWKKALDKGWAKLLDRYPADNKFVQLARPKVEPYDAAELMEKGKKLADSEDTDEWATARITLEKLRSRYPESDQAHDAEPILVRIKAYESARQHLESFKKTGRIRPRELNDAYERALTAMGYEDAGDTNNAKAEWLQLASFSVEDDEYRPWVLLAKHKVRPTKKTPKKED